MSRKKAVLKHAARKPRPNAATKDAVRPPKLAEGLTDKQALFALEFLKDFNATQAAIRAGYSKKAARVHGLDLLQKPVIQDFIAKAQKELQERTKLSLEDLANEMRKLAFVNMQDYMSVGADGDPYLDWSKLTREQAAALCEVTVEDFKDGRGKDARDVRKVRFKLADKRQSIMDLGKLLGVVGPEKIEHSGKLSIEHVQKQIDQETSRLPQAQLEAALPLAKQLLELLKPPAEVGATS